MASNAPNTARIRTIQTSPIFSKVISCCCRSLASRATPRPESTCGRFAVSTLIMPPCENARNRQLSTEETKNIFRLAAHRLSILRAGFVNSSGQILEEDWIAQLLERLAIGNRTQTGRLGGQDSIQPDAIAER